MNNAITQTSTSSRATPVTREKKRSSVVFGGQNVIRPSLLERPIDDVLNLRESASSGLCQDKNFWADYFGSKNLVGLQRAFERIAPDSNAIPLDTFESIWLGILSGAYTEVQKKVIKTELEDFILEDDRFLEVKAEVQLKALEVVKYIDPRDRCRMELLKSPRFLKITQEAQLYIIQNKKFSSLVVFATSRALTGLHTLGEKVLMAILNSEAKGAEIHQQVVLEYFIRRFEKIASGPVKALVIKKLGELPVESRQLIWKDLTKYPVYICIPPPQIAKLFKTELEDFIMEDDRFLQAKAEVQLKALEVVKDIVPRDNCRIELLKSLRFLKITQEAQLYIIQNKNFSSLVVFSNSRALNRLHTLGEKVLMAILNSEAEDAEIQLHQQVVLEYFIRRFKEIASGPVKALVIKKLEELPVESRQLIWKDLSKSEVSIPPLIVPLFEMSPVI